MEDSKPIIPQIGNTRIEIEPKIFLVTVKDEQEWRESEIAIVRENLNRLGNNTKFIITSTSPLEIGLMAEGPKGLKGESCWLGTYFGDLPKTHLIVMNAGWRNNTSWNLFGTIDKEKFSLNFIHETGHAFDSAIAPYIGKKFLSETGWKEFVDNYPSAAEAIRENKRLMERKVKNMMSESFAEYFAYCKLNSSYQGPNAYGNLLICTFFKNYIYTITP